MIKLYDLIMLVTAEPEKHIGKPSVQRLFAFLYGYLDGHPEADDRCLEGFHQYVAEDCYGITASIGWPSVIEYQASNGQEEIKLFRKHFQNFMTIKGRQKEGIPPYPREKLMLSELIGRFLERPGMYIGKYSVQRLYYLLSGFLFENEAGNDHCLDGFSEYVARRCHVSPDHNWADIIELFSGSDKDEIELFRKYFKEYTNG